jgi:hypothetical protein
LPLIGKCPNCAGYQDHPSLQHQHRSGHARICWDPGQPLTTSTQRMDCTSGRMAVLCVLEEGHQVGRDSLR